MNPHYSQVAIRAFHRCEYCHAPEKLFNKEFEVEHIFPTALGGKDGIENLALACRKCNGSKLDFTEGFDFLTREKAGLFNPRKDIWEEHFYRIEETGEVEGRTIIGRATVSRLKINSPKQTAARRVWILYGEY
jgi:HNH endonuclease